MNIGVFFKYEHTREKAFKEHKFINSNNIRVERGRWIITDLNTMDEYIYIIGEHQTKGRRLGWVFCEKEISDEYYFSIICPSIWDEKWRNPEKFPEAQNKKHSDYVTWFDRE